MGKAFTEIGEIDEPANLRGQSGRIAGGSYQARLVFADEIAQPADV